MYNNTLITFTHQQGNDAIAKFENMDQKEKCTPITPTAIKKLKWSSNMTWSELYYQTSEIIPCIDFIATHIFKYCGSKHENLVKQEIKSRLNIKEVGKKYYKKICFNFDDVPKSKGVLEKAIGNEKEGELCDDEEDTEQTYTPKNTNTPSKNDTSQSKGVQNTPQSKDITILLKQISDICEVAMDSNDMIKMKNALSRVVLDMDGIRHNV